LAGTLQIPLEELRTQIGILTEKGFDIALHPLLGIELHSVPEQLVAEDIASRMPHIWLKEIETLPVTPSTNSLALERGLRGDTGPMAFFAETQTAGRGRFGRVWESKQGEGLWMSLLLHPREPMQVWPRLTTIAALALAETIEVVASVQAQIKWPNDVLCGGKKVAGILAETGTHNHSGPFIVLGIGLNVNQTTFPAPLSETATSLRGECGNSINRAELAAQLLSRLSALTALIETDFPSILSRVKGRSSVLGRPLTADAGGLILEGTAEDLDTDGGLVLRLLDGSRRILNAGEVTLRR
jgi:BirA family biotin operon repressor/biotin-[acetyl-CoA-carboxylase] ligase